MTERWRGRKEGKVLGLVYQTPNNVSPAAAIGLMAATLNALEFVEACKELVAKYSRGETHKPSPELTILYESYAGWTLVEHPVGIDEVTIHEQTDLSHLTSRLSRL